MSISFRPLSVGDLPKLADWLAAPHVKKWWPESHDLASIECRYLSIIQGPDATEGFIILTEGCPVGYIQRYRLVDEPEWRRTVSVAVDGLDAAAGIDYLIGDATMIGRGLGSKAITAFVDELWNRFEDITVVVVAVQQLNLGSWRALVKSGFRRVWAGKLDTDDPGDQGPAFLYVLSRPSLRVSTDDRMAD